MHEPTERVTIAVRTPVKGEFGAEEIVAYPTCSEYFVINGSCSVAADGSDSLPTGLWTITHKQSGWAVLGGVASIELARLLAGAISGWPLDWTSDLRKQSGKDLRKLIGDELYFWFLNLRIECDIAFQAAYESLSAGSNKTQ